MAFECLLLVVALLALYLVAHEGGHALASATFGRFDSERSDFFGLRGSPQAGPTMGPPLEPWQQMIVSGAGPFLPTVVGWLFFGAWSAGPIRRWRQARPRVELWFALAIAMLLFPGMITTPLYLLGIITDSHGGAFLSDALAPLWLMHALHWLTVAASAAIFWCLGPTLWKELKRLKAAELSPAAPVGRGDRA